MIMILLTGLCEGARAVVRATGRFLKPIVTAPFRRRSPKVRPANADAAPRGKRILARLFWAFIGSVIFAGGVCCVVAQFLQDFNREETLILAGIGLAVAVFGRRVMVIGSR